MKLRPSVMLVSLVSMFALVGLATAEVPTTESIQAAVLATPAECGNSEVDILANLFAPPIELMSFNDSCGACSVSQCRGANRGQPCWTPYGGWAFCIPATGNFCSGTLEWNCQCANIYL